MSDFNSAHSPENPRELEPRGDSPVAPSAVFSSLPVNCLEFEERVQDLLDRRLDPAGDPAIERHALACAECAGLLADFVFLESVLRNSDEPLHLTGQPGGTLASSNRTSDQTPTARSRMTTLVTPDRTLRKSALLPHPVSRDQRSRNARYLQATLILVALGMIGVGMQQRWNRQATLLPVAGSGLEQNELQLAFGMQAGFRPVAAYRSLEQCYELTAELPGVKPLQTSILVALDWWQHYFGLTPTTVPAARHQEDQFGLNPLLAEGWRRV